MHVGQYVGRVSSPTHFTTSIRFTVCGLIIVPHRRSKYPLLLFHVVFEGNKKKKEKGMKKKNKKERKNIIEVRSIEYETLLFWTKLNLSSRRKRKKKEKRSFLFSSSYLLDKRRKIKRSYRSSRLILSFSFGFVFAFKIGSSFVRLIGNNVRSIISIFCQIEFRFKFILKRYSSKTVGLT